MALHKLIFDTTDANTRADSHTVGAVLYDAANDRLGVINASNQLEVHDADVLSQLQSGVVVTAIDLDIRDLTHVSDSIKVGDGTHFLAINADGSINITDNDGSLTVDGSVSILGDVNVTQGTSPWVVSATDLDIRDLSAAQDSIQSWTHDGTGTAITSTGTSLDVNVTNDIDVDDGLANTAIASNAQASTAIDTAEALVTSALVNRKYLYAYNNDNRTAYIGGATVNAATGFPVPPGSMLELRAGAAVNVQFAAPKIGLDMRTLELS